MQEELNSTHDNHVWDLIDLLNDFKSTEPKWVYKTKMVSKGNVGRCKARLVAKRLLNEKELISLIPFGPYLAKILLKFLFLYYLI